MSAEHVERLRLRHRPDDLFDLVSDVRRYPNFINLISAMRVTREHVDDRGVGESAGEIVEDDGVLGVRAVGLAALARSHVYRLRSLSI